MLTDDQIDRLMNPRKPYSSARAIERAVRKDDEALIQQMLKALEYHAEQTRPIHNTSMAIAAARARLGEKE